MAAFRRLVAVQSGPLVRFACPRLMLRHDIL